MRCSQAAQCGLVVSPRNGLGSFEPLPRAGVGADGFWQGMVQSYGHTQWSMRYNHTTPTSSVEKSASEIMALPPHVVVKRGQFTWFSGRWDYPQARGTRPRQLRQAHGVP